MNFTDVSNWLRINEHEVILVSLCVVALAFSLLNPLWYSQTPGFDGSVFALIGKMWANGEVLYRDMIDIKGPGIFFIDMVGYRIGGYPGIAFVEMLFLIFGVISVDLALRVFKFSPLSRFCSITIVLSLFGFRYYYGNMTEDYSLYAGMTASYPFALMFATRKFKWGMGIIVALLFGLVVSIRVNNSSYFCAWYAMLFMFYIANHRWKDSLYLFFTAVMGLVVVLGLFAYHFYSIGGVELLNEAFFYSFLIFFQDGGYGSSGFSPLVGLVGLFRTGLWAVVIGASLVLFRKDNNLIVDAKYNDRFWFLLYLFLGVVFTVIANSVSGHVYDHYDQLFLPFMFIPLAFMIHRYLHVIQDIHISFLAIFFLLTFLVTEHIIWPWSHYEWTLTTVFIHVGIDTLAGIVLCTILFFLRRKVGIYRHNHTFFLCLSITISFMLGIYAIVLGHTNGRPWDQATQDIVDIVKSETDVTDRIWVEGDQPQYYIWTDRMAAAPQLFFGNVNPGYDVKRKVLNGLAFFKPKYIIVSSRKLEKYREAEKNKVIDTTYTYSEQLFYRYLFTNYDEIVPRLFGLKSKKSNSQGAVAVNINDIEDAQQAILERNDEEHSAEKENTKTSDITTDPGFVIVDDGNSNTSSQSTDSKTQDTDDKTPKSVTSEEAPKAEISSKEEPSEPEVAATVGGLEIIDGGVKTSTPPAKDQTPPKENNSDEKEPVSDGMTGEIKLPK